MQKKRDFFNQLVTYIRKRDWMVQLKTIFKKFSLCIVQPVNLGSGRMGIPQKNGTTMVQ